MAATRTAIIAGNWKMNYGPKQATSFVREIAPALQQTLHHTTAVACILCPPAISLAPVHELLSALHATQITLGAQNMYFEKKGAFTGEISPDMVHELCQSVILGHSERRMYFGESDEQVNKKTHAALKDGLQPIVCIGENSEQHEAQQTEYVIRTQVQHSLAHLPLDQANNVVIAYEPIWAIGTGKAATAEDAGRVIQLIRHLYGEMYGGEAASALRILYGGSVTSTNIREFMVHPDIDGALVGGASLKHDFVEIVRQTVATRQR